MFLKGRNEIIQERLRRSSNSRQMEERITRQQEIQSITAQAGENKRLMEKEREQLTGNDMYHVLEKKVMKII
jgi:hypothetical protein